MENSNESVRQMIGTKEWLRWRAKGAIQHLHRCPECGARPDRGWRSAAPRWDEDPVAAMFDDLDGRCGRCGKEVSR